MVGVVGVYKCVCVWSWVCSYVGDVAGLVLAVKVHPHGPACLIHGRLQTRGSVLLVQSLACLGVGDPAPIHLDIVDAP